MSISISHSIILALADLLSGGARTGRNSTPEATAVADEGTHWMTVSPFSAAP